MREPPGLHWHYREFRLERYDVRFVEPRQCKFEGSFCCGYTDFARREILISVAQPIEQIGPTYIHECLHAIAGHGRCERFIRCIDVNLWQFVSSGGFKMPRFPKGFKEFRERAMFASGEMLIA